MTLRAEINVENINNLAKSDRLQCASYSNDNLFRFDASTTGPNYPREMYQKNWKTSEILSISFGSGKVVGLEMGDLRLKFKKVYNNEVKCVFWDTRNQKWSDEASDSPKFCH